ncbi:hypothetical protein EST38_g11602 [Candolleomyces aberdarensis]|uniref:Mitochondrial K+-H+ exchange-related-domain-containing protein n=1 Tax=Candolleomyces aberdarensis TaxID=2316362 RepID=A0A4Q2D5Y3_9AGAR|nr:hypothetical protein EST38_g11602 [Candolleomyces aberdarensis]
MSVPGGAAALRHGLRKSTRIIAIPLSRPLPPRALASTNNSLPTGNLLQPNGGQHGPGPLTYYHFQLSSKKKRREKEKEVSQKEKEGNEPEGETKPKSRWSLPEGGITAWVQAKAAETWAGFGKAEGGWKLYVFRTGERIVDRMEFEELALKSIDPSLGPTITHPRSSEMDSEQKEQRLEEKGGAGSGPSVVRIPLVYPPSALTSELAVSELRMYVQHRIPVHRKGFYLWMFIAPLTAPFMIIPVIPNIPFFFCVWRSWSHYRAYRASQYLETLLDKGAIVPESSEELDAVYANFASPPSPSSPSPSSSSSGPSASSSAPQDASSSGAEAPQHQLLLTKDAVPTLVERFELGSHAKADLYRAFEQFQLLDGLKAKENEGREEGRGTQLVSWAQRKVVGMWDGFGKAEGGWRLRVHKTGKRYFNSIDFEEFALKSIDPALGPSMPFRSSNKSLLENRKDIGAPGLFSVGKAEVPSQLRIPLLYPPSVLTPSLALQELREYVEHRIPLHRKGLYTWSLLTPFTFPLKFIPIIPNLPFFFCAWRLWSHYRALRASQYLQTLLNHDAIVPESSEALDKFYSEFPVSSSLSSSSLETPNQHRLLLSKDVIPALVEQFVLEATAKVDLERALEQVKARVQIAGQ